MEHNLIKCILNVFQLVVTDLQSFQDLEPTNQ